MSARPTPEARRAVGTRLRERVRGVSGATTVLVLAGLWRSTLGVDLSDEAHAVALAVRIAGGGVPFQDEMNTQALGALPAAPFTWLWLHTVGSTGVVVVNRLLFVAGTLAVGMASYRFLRGHLPPWAAWAAVATPLCAPAYNILVVSYNTVPLWSLVLGTSAGLAAIREKRAAPTITATLALAAGVACYPPMVVAAAPMLAVVLLRARSREVTRWVVVVGTAAAIGVGLVFLLVFTVPAVSDTLRYAGDFLGHRLPTAARWRNTTQLWTTELLRPRHLPATVLALALAALAARRPPRHRLTAAVAVLTVVAAVAPAWVAANDQGRPFGAAATVAATYLVLALLPATVVLALRHQGVVRELALVGLAGGPLVPVIVQTTSSGPAWGVLFLGLAPLSLAVVAAWATLVELPRFQSLVAVPVVMVAAVLLLVVFRQPAPWLLTERVTAGPFAGSLTTPAVARELATLDARIDTLVGSSRTLLIYWHPGAYLLSDARPDTPLLWLINDGAANAELVPWMEEHPHPDVVLVHRVAVDTAGSWARLVATDPLVAWLDGQYQVTAPTDSPYWVLRPKP